jgi:hypothetical protein
MGFLSKSAEKAFKMGKRRSYVPDWFQPVSYALGALGLLVLVFGVLTSEDLPETAVNPAPIPAVSSTDGDGGGSITSLPSAAATTDPSTSEPGGLFVPVGPDGATVDVPLAAVEIARAAAAGLFTGDFSAVVLFPGQEPPVVGTIWPAPVVGEPASAEQLADGTWLIGVIVDPDAAGTELARSVPIFVGEAGDSWGYLPG